MDFLVDAFADCTVDDYYGAIDSTSTEKHSLFPQLPSLYDKARLPAIIRGPTDESNWVIPNYLLCGAHPYLVNENSAGETLDEVQADSLTRLLKCGVRVFLCLHAEDCKFPYRAVAEKIASAISEEVRDLDFQHAVPKKGGHYSDIELFELAHSIIDNMVLGKIVYMHAKGGHGRTTVVAACVLGLLYPHLTANQVSTLSTIHGWFLSSKNQMFIDCV